MNDSKELTRIFGAVCWGVFSILTLRDAWKAYEVVRDLGKAYRKYRSYGYGSYSVPGYLYLEVASFIIMGIALVVATVYLFMNQMDKAGTSMKVCGVAYMFVAGIVIYLLTKSGIWGEETFYAILICVALIVEAAAYILLGDTLLEKDGHPFRSLICFGAAFGILLLVVLMLSSEYHVSAWSLFKSLLNQSGWTLLLVAGGHLFLDLTMKDGFGGPSFGKAYGGAAGPGAYGNPGAYGGQGGPGYGAGRYGTPGYGAGQYGTPGYGAPNANNGGAYGAPYGGQGGPGYGAGQYGTPGYGAPNANNGGAYGVPVNNAVAGAATGFTAPAGAWRCNRCKSVNAGYMGACSCGMTRQNSERMDKYDAEKAEEAKKAAEDRFKGPAADNSSGAPIAFSGAMARERAQADAQRDAAKIRLNNDALGDETETVAMENPKLSGADPYGDLYNRYGSGESTLGRGFEEYVDSSASPVRTSVCPHCGAPIASDDVFCNTCGQRI